jgi:hypothetical protein
MAILERTPSRTLLLLSLALARCLSAQPAAVSAPAKNLKLIPANVDLTDVMRGFNDALGVQCNYCHVPGDFASDANPLKETARSMITLVRQTEAFFPSTGGPFPSGYHEVDCFTCHRGKAKPDAPKPVHFQTKREVLVGVTDSGPGTNLKVLPPDTRVHGSGSLMEDFRDALNVDCAYCHGGGKNQADDSNPRKDISRRMIELQRRINANFPGTGVYPQGPQVVTCNTCHRGDPHPASFGNRRYEVPAAPVP